MVSALFSRLARLVSQFLHQPILVLSICLALVSFGLILDGSLFRLWSLYRDSRSIQEKIVSVERASERLAALIERSNDPQYMELQARERFDYVEKNDLVFVFSDEE
jgi:cell division protein FtsB